MATKWRVVGNYEWTEERHYDCSARIDAVVEADDKDRAIALAIKQIDGDADEEDCSYSDSGAWKRGSKKSIKIEIIETDDPALMEYESNRRNIEYMKQYSTPLF